MAATPSIRVVKNFPYRGATRPFSNRYHFNGGTPPDTAHWTTFSDAVVAAEKAALYAGVTIVATYGYNAGSEVPVFTKTYTTVGLLALGTWALSPGDAACLVRYSTTARTSKNHPVYLYNYYHGCLSTGPGSPDTVASAMTSAMGTYAAAWISGFSDGATSYNRAGPNGATAVGALVLPKVTHRDLPR